MMTKEEYERDIKEAYAKGYYAALDALRAGYTTTLEFLKIRDVSLDTLVTQDGDSKDG